MVAHRWASKENKLWKLHSYENRPRISPNGMPEQTPSARTLIIGFSSSYWEMLAAGGPLMTTSEVRGNANLRPSSSIKFTWHS